jgi:hypothetical protein
MHKLTTLAAVALCAAASAQVTSPIGYDTTEGNSNNTFPFFSSLFHYQQIHGDIRGTPRQIRALGFRRDGTLGAGSYGARTVTLDMWLGDANLAAVTGTFASNFIGMPTQVIANKPFNLPDYSNPFPSIPSPVDQIIVLDAPYVHTAINDLCWEVQLLSNTNTAGRFMDAASGTGGGTQVGSFTSHGTGCTTSTGTMTLRNGTNFTTNATTMNFGWATTFGPPSAATTVLLGIANPNLPLPGLCGGGRVHVSPVLVTINGTTSAAGAWTTPTISTPHNPALVGFAIFAQSASADGTQPGLPIAASNGVRSVITDTAKRCDVTRVYLSGSNGPVGTVGVNYGLVTLFR